MTANRPQLTGTTLEPSPVTRYHTACPVCDGVRWTFLAPTWRDYFLPARFRIDDSRWFTECDDCGTIVMLPLVEYAQIEDYGKAYYDQHGDTETAEQHAISHFEKYQKPNYDNIRTFLRRTHPADTYRHWLDVGSVGYPATFADYDFTTIEPDPRAVAAGRRRFGSERIHCATIETWRTGRLYDGVLFNNSFYCITTPGAALDAAHGMLRPGGRLVITLSGYLNGAVSDRVDGLILLIEDVLFGETLQVYYNQHSLTYLAGRHGFRFIGVAEVPAYGRKTMNAYTFERVADPVTQRDLIDRSRVEMRDRWKACFEGFRSSIASTLTAINHPRTVLAGSPVVVRDLQRYGGLSRVRGFMPVPDLHLTGVRCGSVPIIGPSDLAGIPVEDYEVVVCSFQRPDEVAAWVRREVGESTRLHLPTRRSGMEFVDFSFRDGCYPSKGFALAPPPAPPAARARVPVDLAGRRLVLFGAGAGGTGALARLRAAGRAGQVVAFCDNDATRHGTMIKGIPVRDFDGIDPAAFDLVVITSEPGRTTIAAQLRARGFVDGRDVLWVGDCLLQPEPDPSTAE